MSQQKKQTPTGKSLKQEKPKAKKSMLREIIETIVMAAALYFAIDFCVARVRVENISMEKTFTAGELLMVNRLNYKFSEPQRGDVVIFDAPKEPGKDYIKRLIGIPGDHIHISDGKLSINGEIIDEPWLHEPIQYAGDWDVPEGQYFVLGDNRNHSSDSHVWGFVPKKNFVGNAFFVYWPLNKISIINDSISLEKDKVKTVDSK